MAHHRLRHRHAVARLLVAALLLFAGVTAVVRVGAQTQTSPPVPASAPAPPSAPGPDEDVETQPVELDGVVLFRVRGVSAFPAAQRARRIREELISPV